MAPAAEVLAVGKEQADGDDTESGQVAGGDGFAEEQKGCWQSKKRLEIVEDGSIRGFDAVLCIQVEGEGEDRPGDGHVEDGG